MTNYESRIVYLIYPQIRNSHSVCEDIISLVNRRKGKSKGLKALAVHIIDFKYK